MEVAQNGSYIRKLKEIHYENRRRAEATTMGLRIGGDNNTENISV